MLKRIIKQIPQTQQQRDDAEFALYLEILRKELIADQKSICDRPLTGPLIVFLDFDDVLHPGNSGTLRELPRFETLMRRYQFDVVITSDWRIGASMNGLREKFSPDLQPRVVGKTSKLDNRYY